MGMSALSEQDKKARKSILEMYAVTLGSLPITDAAELSTWLAG